MPVEGARELRLITIERLEWHQGAVHGCAQGHDGGEREQLSVRRIALRWDGRPGCYDVCCRPVLLSRVRARSIICPTRPVARRTPHELTVQSQQRSRRPHQRWGGRCRSRRRYGPERMPPALRRWCRHASTPDVPVGCSERRSCDGFRGRTVTRAVGATCATWGRGGRQPWRAVR